ncbi:hypothetical protein [Rhizobium rhizogenes]|uniref:hypothetical protein n=1 Tax=Rhizobium rhizogenes TaxID=359 RepID=UPI0015722E09|nr:hypothetical protein [Rhizobium rhizogenes]NTG41674.1 hypothetical protein [Rhizobium rhizogenes]
MAFQLPVKGDMDRLLSKLMHDARHKLMFESNRIMGEAAQVGALRGNRVLTILFTEADDIHKAAMSQAAKILLDFIQRMKRRPAEITGWALPHLENLGESLLGVIKPNGFPDDRQRFVGQYRAVFKQRLDGLLRDVEIGHVDGAGFARADEMESKEEWINAAGALALMKSTMHFQAAARAICTRAYDGMLRARAERFVREEGTNRRSADNIDVPKEFWWACGDAALDQNWSTGDFETWIDNRIHLKAYSVSFLRAEIVKMVPSMLDNNAPSKPIPSAQSVNRGGRPPAGWWEDCLVHVCFKYFRGELSHPKQSDIVRVMQDWISEHGYEEVADSTVKIRARKLMDAIKRDEGAEN